MRVHTGRSGGHRYPPRMDERVLAERLITYDTSNVEGLRAAAGFIKGWLEARDIAVQDHQYGDVFALTAEVGPSDGPTLVFHGHYDVVPARPEQFTPRIQGDRLEGRGAYDMKGGLAAMMCALQDMRDQSEVRVRFVCVPDEESEEIDQRTSDLLVKAGHVGDFAITGEPTNLHVGVQAKGVLALRIMVFGTSAHGSTPWLGDNAVLKAIDVFRRIESMPFTLESSELFDRPSVNLGRIIGGRRAQQGARGMRHGRGHPLPPRTGPRRVAGADPRRCRTSTSPAPSSGRPRACRPRTRTCSRSARRPRA